MYNPKGNFKPKIISKSEEEKEKIKNLIKDIFMFKSLEEKDMNIIIDSMEEKKFVAGDRVIN